MTASPLKVTGGLLKVTTGLLKVTTGTLNMMTGTLNMTTGWGHLSSHLRDQGGLKLQYITLHYTHYITLLGKMTYIFEISANNAIK